MGRTDVFAAGIDIGSVAVKGIILDGDGAIRLQLVETVGGSLSLAISRLVEGLLSGITGEMTLGVTGCGRDLFMGFDSVWSENDLVSISRAVGLHHPDVRGVIEVGGHQSMWLRLDSDRCLESFAINDQCAAGSGAFLEQQAGRLKMDIDTFADKAMAAQGPASIAGRCAVFAKSDMIHLQQKGTAVEEIVYGLCLALARNFRATLLRGTEPALPAIFTGGGALNAGLHRAFCEAFGLREDQLIRTPEARHLAALGAALGAREQARTFRPDTIRTWLESGRDRVGNAGETLAALGSPEGEQLPEPRIVPTGDVSAFLGVDVGSVSTDLCLLSPEGEVLDGIYLRTRGNPVGVLREGLSILRDRTRGRLRVLGAGTTGSGRHLAGRLLGADVVKNEITCQLLGARHVLPEVDTILEIGGQDSKYVSVHDDHIADFVMNKICAAGTGSFLEEQGEALGVSIQGEFEALALQAERPASLGSQCTVFMENEVVAARQLGTSLNDILAGLALSVARNYLDRVVAGRSIGDHVVFQGGVASNRAVVAAFEALLGKRLTVHPYNRLSGAIGAAVAARAEVEGRASAFRGLDAAESARVKTFECGSCSNVCQVSRVRIEGKSSYFGDVCEKYSAREAEGSTGKIPDLVGEVVERLESFAGGEARLGTVGIPRASMMYDLFPFWATFLRSLGFRVVLGGPSKKRTLDDGIGRLTAETCLPVKLIYGHVVELLEGEEALDFVFLPAIQDIPDSQERVSHLCPFEESAAFMVGSFAADRMIAPTVHLAASRKKIARVLWGSLRQWDLSEDRIDQALDAAYEAQEGYEEALRKRGSEVLAGDFETAFVLLGKPYNITDPFENLNLAGHIRKLGVPAIPQQMLPLEPVDLGQCGITIPWRYNRDHLQAMRSILKDPRLLPVFVSNFGCGPDAFAMKFLEKAALDRPYLYLEFDEHRGEAGLITRLEAFIDEVRSRPLGASDTTPSFTKPPDRAGGRYKGRRLILPNFADHAYAFEGALRFAGLDAVVLPPPDEETISRGEEMTTGKECHPYVLIAGDLLKHLDRGTIRPGDVYFFPGTEIPCLMHEYASNIRLELERRGIRDIDVLSPDTESYLELLGMPGLVRLGRGLITADLMTKLRCQVRPYADQPDRMDDVFERAFPLMASMLAEDRVGDALEWLVDEIDAIPRAEGPQRPLVGVAGDIYTRIHSFGNRDLFRQLEALGLEVWPAPFLVDSVDFGFRRKMAWGLDDGRYGDVASTAVLFMKKGWESLRARFLLGNRVERVSEPGYAEVLSLAAPYVDPRANETIILNAAKMVDYARRGAHGVINAISFHCMLGTVSASMTERIRRDHGRIPILNLVYSGKEAAETRTKIETFAHQVKAFARQGKATPEPRPKLPSRWKWPT